MGNSKSLPCLSLKMMWLLNSQFDQNLIVIYHKSNGEFKSYIIF
jgi:hypothetical protein